MITTLAVPYYTFTPTHGFVAGWGTLSLINAGLAQGKHRSGLAWWVISLFLGPVATFLIVILPRR